ncbi:MAG: hypothetical protein CMJ58_23830 [Planctomycetaceae bacterium]|nr:hypothetical protein [Planctomycetaceae bacterium]
MPHLPSLGLHRSSKVVAALTAAMMTVIVVPGMVENSETAGAFPCSIPSASAAGFPLGQMSEPPFGRGIYLSTSCITAQTFQHGWPVCYLRRSVIPATFLAESDSRPDWCNDYPIVPAAGVPWLAKNAWMPWQHNDGIAFSPVALVLDGLIGVFVVAAVTAAWERRARRTTRRARISLQDLLGALTLAAILMGWYSYNRSLATAERQITNRLERYVSQNGDQTPHVSFDLPTCCAPLWLQRLCGPGLLPRATFGVTVAEIAFRKQAKTELRQEEHSENPGDVCFALLRDLPRLRTLGLGGALPDPIGDYADSLTLDAVRKIASLKSLRRLIVADAAQLSAEARELLATELPNCEILCECGDPY